MPAPPFETFMSGVMARLGLSDTVDQVVQVLRRIEILSNSIVVRFDRANMLAAWRAADPGQRRRRATVKSSTTAANSSPTARPSGMKTDS